MQQKWYVDVRNKEKFEQNEESERNEKEDVENATIVPGA